MLKTRFGCFGKTTRRAKISHSRPRQLGRHARFETLETRQLLSITLPTISNVTLPAGTTVYVPLSGASSGQTVHYAVTASDYSKLTPVTMPESNKTLRFNVDINGTIQSMDFQLFDNLAPATTAAIESLVQSGFYNGLQIYRNGKDQSGNPFVIQGGNNPPTGNIKTSQSSMAEEFNPNLQYTTAGLLAMARTNTPSSSSTEFFVTEQAARFLDYNYTLFGIQTAGANTIEAIAAMPNQSVAKDPNGLGYLVTPLTITSASIFEDTQGGVLQLSAPAGVAGTVTITVTASDGTSTPMTETFVVTIEADGTLNPANPFAAVVPSAPTSVAFVPPADSSAQTTNLNNSSSSSALQFLVSGVTNGNVVEILCDGNVIGEATVSGTSVTVTTDGSTTLSDGNHTFTAIQIAKDQTVSVIESGSSTPLGKKADVPGQNSPAVTLTVAAPPAVTINQAVKQKDPTNATTINFTVVFSEPVSDFATGDVTISGTAGATTAIVTGDAGGTTYNVAVSGMTNDGTVIVTLAEGVAHDAAGNPNTVSTSTDNSVTYDATAPTVTIDQATGQADPTGASTITFKVVFSEPVKDFAAADVTFGGAALGKLTAKVNGSGTTYDVAVSGMTTTGTVIASVAAGAAHDNAGNGNAASTSSDNTVQFVLAFKPTFRVTAPTSGTYTVGQTVVIGWYATNVVQGTNVSLCYDTDTSFNRTERWIEVEQAPAANGYGVYSWNTTGATPGTYHIGGYLYSGKAYWSCTPQTITILPPPKPAFQITSPTSGTFTVGQSVVIAWSVGNLRSNGTISLCYDTDTAINRTEKYIEVDQVTAKNGYGTYTWDTSKVAPGTYYMAGYLWSDGRPTFTHLYQTITILAPPKPTFRITAPTSGTYAAGQNVTVYWSAANVPSGSTISLCYDQDLAINHTEKYFEVDQVTAKNGYDSYTWNTAGVKPGTYYLAGYLWSNGRPTFSHLSQPITITASALTVEASTPPSQNVSLLTDAQLQPIIVEAERRLTAALGIQVAAAMTGVTVQIGDLPGNMLGEAAGNTIYISSNAAGYGWFVDSTPADDSEFADVLGPNALAARKGSPAANRVDLLTTVMHEMTHVLGYGHSDSFDLMYPTLPLGERRLLDKPLLPPMSRQDRVGASDSPLIGPSAIDQVFASTAGDQRSWVLP